MSQDITQTAEICVAIKRFACSRGNRPPVQGVTWPRPDTTQARSAGDVQHQADHGQDVGRRLLHLTPASSGLCRNTWAPASSGAVELPPVSPMMTENSSAAIQPVSSFTASYSGRRGCASSMIWAPREISRKPWTIARPLSWRQDESGTQSEALMVGQISGLIFA